MADSNSFNDGFESPRLPARPFVMITAGVAIFLALGLGGLWTLFALDAPNRRAVPATNPPPPRLESHPMRELQHTRLTERARLNAAATGEIPIDRAMAIISARGATAYDPITPVKRPP